MEPFRNPEDLERHVAKLGHEAQPCMLCGARRAPHVRDLTLLAADGHRLVIVARFCRACHARPDRAARTLEKLRALGVNSPEA
jgi:hypothetical protein